MQLDEQTLVALAPTLLVNLRVARYVGDGMAVQMADLTVDDARNVRRLYDSLAELLGRLREALCIPAGDGVAPGGFSNGSPDVHDASTACIAAAMQVLADTAKDPAWRDAIGAARALRAPISNGDTTQRQAIHDIRGGALAALSLTIDLAGYGRISTADVVRTFYLTRDHLKIMRNALEDIDVAARQRDMNQRDHGAHLLLEKWTSAEHRQPDDRSARVNVHTTYEGPVSQRCLEFSALDRVLYNLMNNAVRFSSDGAVDLHLRALGENLRFVVANRVTTDQRSTLGARYATGLGKLFLDNFTTGGEGVGMTICAEFVANAYGLSKVKQAVNGGYVGAELVGDAFVAWFHWPVGK
ncbi:MAG: ATP-binding protein [Gemmatimonadaceae bacterium]